MASYTLTLKKETNSNSNHDKGRTKWKQPFPKRTALHLKEKDKIDSEQQLNSLCTISYSKPGLLIILDNEGEGEKQRGSFYKKKKKN